MAARTYTEARSAVRAGPLPLLDPAHHRAATSSPSPVLVRVTRGAPPRTALPAPSWEGLGNDRAASRGRDAELPDASLARGGGFGARNRSPVVDRAPGVRIDPAWGEEPSIGMGLDVTIIYARRGRV